MPAPQTGVQRVIEAAGGKQPLADLWNVSYQAIDKFERNGYFPLDRAKIAAKSFGIPLRDLARSDIRSAMDTQ